MPRRILSLLALLAALFTALLTSCGGPSQPLPDGAKLLSDSSNAMKTVTSTKANIDVEGTVPGIPIKSAEGVLKKDGSAKGAVSLDMGAQPFELAFVIIGKDLYLKGPTGGFRKLSYTLPYDPTLIMDPKRGLPNVLSSGTESETETQEQTNGVDSYRVQTKFPQAAIGKLVPGYDPNSESQVWIASKGFRVVQAEFPTTDGKITLRFSDYDAPVAITPPI
jgi:lipoprotein LprG